MAKATNYTSVNIPDALMAAVKERRAVVFLGAGASKEANNAAGASPPNADELRDILAQRFYGRAIPNRDLMAVAEMAIAANGGASLVYEAVRKAFDGFEPSEAHKLLGAFNWRMIATTNYDLLVEKAYQTTKPLQTLVRFVKDGEPVEDRLQSVRHPVQYLKLHGCLDHTHDADIPLVLSREQYAKYSQNRVRLFGRLRDLAHESALVFIGYRLDDPHIRELIYNLDSSKRPRWFIVTPDAETYDIDFWGTQNVEVVKSRFGDFMRSLDAAVPELWRALPTDPGAAELPLRRFYSTHQTEGEAVRASLTDDLTHVHSGMPYADQSPSQFYSGYDTGWGAIHRRFDVRRKVEEEALFRWVLENDKATGPALYVFRGPAGAGKTIALKRTAFEAATSADALVLWLNERGALRADVIFEIAELTQRPIFLFIDQIGLHLEKVEPLLRKARAKSIPLIVIAAEREADWNTYCSYLEEEFEPSFLRVGRLSTSEVEGLLDLLERYDYLGQLKELSREQQVAAFMDEARADRHLLVALHELTEGRPFEEIVFAEYERISPEAARQLYLDIATMHQFGVDVRAGTVSRISGIDFENFSQEFIAPLEEVVRTVRDPYTGDWLYRTRHSRVARLVFREACASDAAKAAQLRRLIEGFDAGYSSDRRALEEITRGRTMAGAFGAVEEPRAIYEAATAAAPEQGYLYQQWAIFEMNHPHGSLVLAEEKAAVARERDPRNRTIIHTQAEIDRRRANDEKSSLLKDTLRRRARARLEEMRANDRFSMSSRCKLLVDEVTELGAALGDNPKPHEVIAYAEKLKDAEAALARAQQSYPDDADIFQVEARLRTVLNQTDKSLRALEKAWAANPRGSGTAIRIARIYRAKNQDDASIKILREALGREPDDKGVHFELAQACLAVDPPDDALIESHLRKSFSRDDGNFEPRYMLAQFMFSRGKLEDAVNMFDDIAKRAPESFRNKMPREDNDITSRLPSYSGTITSQKDGFLFIRSGIYPRDIFAHYSNIGGDDLDDLYQGAPVRFSLRFNRSGPVALNVKLDR